MTTARIASDTPGATGRRPIRQTVVFPLLAVILGSALGFALVEVATRMFRRPWIPPYQYDPVLGARLIPNHRGRDVEPGDFEYRWTHGHDGLRISGPAPVNAAERVLLLGDSFTWGYGVNDDQSFASAIQRSLAQGPQPAKILNAGIPGTGTDYALRYFEMRGRDFRPTLTVLCFFSNDFDDTAKQRSYRLDERDQAVPTKVRTWVLSRLPGYVWLMTWSHAANMAREVSIELLTGHTPANIAAEASLGFSTPENVRLTSAFLERLRNDVEGLGPRPLVVFYVPRREEVEAWRKQPAPAADEVNLQEICRTLSIDLMSLTPVIAASSLATSRLYFQEGHWTAEGHGVAATFMAARIKERLARGN